VLRTYTVPFRAKSEARRTDITVGGCKIGRIVARNEPNDARRPSTRTCPHLESASGLMEGGER
jgi:hypothetical protein